MSYIRNMLTLANREEPEAPEPLQTVTYQPLQGIPVAYIRSQKESALASVFARREKLIAERDRLNEAIRQTDLVIASEKASLSVLATDSANFINTKGE